MKISYLRSSSINGYKDCEWKYFLDYVCHFPTDGNKKAMLGTIVHHVLEIMARLKKTGHYKLEDKFCNYEYLLDICFDRYYRENEEVFDWSINEDKKFCKEQVESVLNSRFHPFNLDILKTEHQFEIEVRKPGFDKMKMRGTIDLITEFDEDTIEIIDYKTGERLNWVGGGEKEYEDFCKDIQLRFYNLATSVLYPHKYRMFTIIYTRSGGPFTVTFSEKEFKETIDSIRKIYREIKGNTRPKRLKSNPERAYKEAWKCKYVCDYGKYWYEYISQNGEIIEKYFKQKVWPPKKIYENGQTYTLIPKEKETLCDRFYKMFLKSNLEKTEQKIYNITHNGNDVSRRNNYEHSKIDKKVLE